MRIREKKRISKKRVDRVWVVFFFIWNLILFLNIKYLGRYLFDGRYKSYSLNK